VTLSDADVAALAREANDATADSRARDAVAKPVADLDPR
jgi:hypothetical protein